MVIWLLKVADIRAKWAQKTQRKNLKNILTFFRKKKIDPTADQDF